jgi:uracil-DNA glycosylase
MQVSRTARILIAGQAPGVRVHRSGRPFTDPSGDRLRAWLGLTPDQFYDASRIAIVAMGFCFPGLSDKGADLPPRRECAPAWRHNLMAALPQIELVLAVGRYAQEWHMPAIVKPSLTATLAAWREGLELTPPVMPLPHPSWRNNGWLKANPWFEAEVLPELRARMAALL